jgi:hypothetical protein
MTATLVTRQKKAEVHPELMQTGPKKKKKKKKNPSETLRRFL